MHLLTEFVSLEDIENTLTNKIIYLEMKILKLWRELVTFLNLERMEGVFGLWIKEREMEICCRDVPFSTTF